MVKLPSIPLDKQAHFLGGYALAVTFGMVCLPLGLVVALVAAAGKEVYDHYHPESHTADVKDFYATALGGIAGVLVLLIL